MKFLPFYLRALIVLQMKASRECFASHLLYVGDPIESTLRFHQPCQQQTRNNTPTDTYKIGRDWNVVNSLPA